MKYLVYLSLASLLTSLVAFGQTTQPPDGFGTTELTADLSPQNLVPPVVDRTESGRARVEITLVQGAPAGPNSGVVSFEITLENALAEDFTGIAIHQGVEGLNGPPVLQAQFDASEPVLGNVLSGQIPITSPTQIESLLAVALSPADFHILLTATDSPDGLLRGQLRGSDMGEEMTDLNTKVDRIKVQLDTIQVMVRRVGLVLGIAPEFLPQPDGETNPEGNGAEAASTSP